MNFIDEVLKNLGTMRADDVIQSMARIYEKVIERTKIAEYPQFIQDIIYIIELDTELAMSGIGGVLDNNIGEYMNEIILALQNIHANRDAQVLQQIINLYNIDETGEKINELADQLYLYTDFDIWSLLEFYVEKEKEKYTT